MWVAEKIVHYNAVCETQGVRIFRMPNVILVHAFVVDYNIITKIT